MTPTELRAIVETDLPEGAVSTLIKAAEEAIEDRLGEVGTISESREPHGPLIVLSRRAVEVLEVTDRGDVVDPSDYALRPSGDALDRVEGRWRGRVVVTYQPRPDTARRAKVTADLVRLDIEHHPGLASARFGSWAESYAQAGDATYEQKREAILCTLFDDEGFIR